MKTIELLIMTLGTFTLYGSYIYYLLTMNRSTKPGNLWYYIGDGIDMIFFNSGIKPRKEIKDNPNRILEWVNTDEPDDA